MDDCKQVFVQGILSLKSPIVPWKFADRSYTSNRIHSRSYTCIVNFSHHCLAAVHSLVSIHRDSNEVFLFSLLFLSCPYYSSQSILLYPLPASPQRFAIFRIALLFLFFKIPFVRSAHFCFPFPIYVILKSIFFQLQIPLYSPSTYTGSSIGQWSMQ